MNAEYLKKLFSFIFDFLLFSLILSSLCYIAKIDDNDFINFGILAIFSLHVSIYCSHLLDKSFKKKK